MGESHKSARIISLCLVALLPGELSAQDDRIPPQTLLVGAVELEPFAMKTVDDHGRPGELFIARCRPWPAWRR
jgi:hypothetical protein